MARPTREELIDRILENASESDWSAEDTLERFIIPHLPTKYIRDIYEAHYSGIYDD